MVKKLLNQIAQKTLSHLQVGEEASQFVFDIGAG
jgi:hypothetical protein